MQSQNIYLLTTYYTAVDTSTTYMGLPLRTPIIVGSRGLTNNLEDLLRIERSGAGAVVLKSVFEEEIIFDIKRNTHITAPVENYGESYEYIASHVVIDSMQRHLDLIKNAKRNLSIPVIGSINCFSHDTWINYAKHFEDAGCDALELNMAILPYETTLSADDVERLYNNIVRHVKQSLTIPFSVKIGPYFTDMAKFVSQLSWSGIDGITMFNKSMKIDIDIDEMTMKSASCLSNEDSLYDTLRWVSILAKKLKCQISASGGVHKPEDVIKLLLAGAGSVQVVSCLYKYGVNYIETLNSGLSEWMAKKGYDKIDDFRGKMSIPTSEKASIAMRTQFMRYFAEIK